MVPTRIRLNAFRRSTIPQKQFIIIIITTLKGPQRTQQQVMITLRYLKSSSIYLRTPSFRQQLSLR